MTDTSELDRRSLLLATGALAAAGSVPAKAAPPVHAPDLMRHRFGLNYVPSRNWYYNWNDWDARSVARDLDSVASVGADHIRLMLVWPYFQPNQTYVSTAHLDRLDALMELAAARRIDVMVTPFTGWLSGFTFRPPFLESEPFFTSQKWLDAQTFFLTKLSARLGRHANFLGYDIGNEINCLWTTGVKTNEGDAWMTQILAAMHRLSPGRVHVNGVDNRPWFREDTFSPQALVAQQKIVALHSWSFWTGAGKHSKPLGEAYTRLPAAFAALARSYAADATRPVWLQEFGVCNTEMPDADVPRWMELAVGRAVAEGVSWFTWWSSHDVPKSLDFHPFEYDLGLFDANNKLKPRGATFKHLADRYRGKPVVPPKRLATPPTEARNDDSTWRWLLAWMRDNPLPA